MVLEVSSHCITVSSDQYQKYTNVVVVLEQYSVLIEKNNVMTSV